MRTLIGSALAATALVGCASQDTVALEYRSELTAQTRGVQLGEDGRSSNVGMFSTTCQVATAYASVSDDFDYDGDQDTVVDAETVPGIGFTALVITPDKVNITRPNQFPWSTEVTVDGVIDAQLSADGFVTIEVPPVAGNASCNVAWYDDSGQLINSAASLGIECDQDSDLAVDGQSGTSWVSTDTGTFKVTPDGTAVRVDDIANARLSWDVDANALYLGGVGGSAVRALELDGTLRWQVDLDGEVTALSHTGAEAAAAVSITNSLGGELVIIDGFTGEVRADLPTPSAASSVDVSGNGRVMAVSLPNSVYYFDILALD